MFHVMQCFVGIQTISENNCLAIENSCCDGGLLSDIMRSSYDQVVLVHTFKSIPCIVFVTAKCRIQLSALNVSSRISPYSICRDLMGEPCMWMLHRNTNDRDSNPHPRTLQIQLGTSDDTHLGHRNRSTRPRPHISQDWTPKAARMPAIPQPFKESSCARITARSKVDECHNQIQKIVTSHL